MTKPEGAEIWSAGQVNKPLTEREARVVPLGLEWDRVAPLEDVAALRAHIANCYAADCAYMARRAERKLREIESNQVKHAC